MHCHSIATTSGSRADTSVYQAHTAKVRPFTSPTIAKINQRAARFWFTGIAFSIVSSVYRLVDLNRREQQARRVRSAEKEVERKAELKAVVA